MSRTGNEMGGAPENASAAPGGEPAVPADAAAERNGVTNDGEAKGEKNAGQNGAQTTGKNGGKDAAERPAKRRKSGWAESLLLIAGGVAVALLLRAFVIGTFWIPSESMENTLLENDRVVINRLSGSPQRGDVVVFKGWDGQEWIKRVIAVGGDTVKCCDKKHRLSVNGVPLDEDYLYPGDYASGESFEVKVPKGRLWVMGDHRVASRDSRAFINDKYSGTISEEAVLGRAWAVYWPPSRMKLLETPKVFEKVPSPSGASASR
ncbi:MAG: signal peptidase I [Actinomycetes bacterium]|jgi:signal peptidase I